MPLADTAPQRHCKSRSTSCERTPYASMHKSRSSSGRRTAVASASGSDGTMRANSPHDFRSALDAVRAPPPALRSPPTAPRPWSAALPVAPPARSRPRPRPAGPPSGAMYAGGIVSDWPGRSACEDSGVRTADAASGTTSAAAALAASSTPASSPTPAELPAERGRPSGDARGAVGSAGAELDSGATPWAR